MYLYDDFNSVIKKLINDKLLIEYKIYDNGSFLSSSNINK